MRTSLRRLGSRLGSQLGNLKAAIQVDDKSLQTLAKEALDASQETPCIDTLQVSSEKGILVKNIGLRSRLYYPTTDHTREQIIRNHNTLVQECIDNPASKLFSAEEDMEWIHKEQCLFYLKRNVVTNNSLPTQNHKT